MPLSSRILFERAKTSPPREHAATSFPREVGIPVSALVIVESPAKAKTVGKYLGAGYRVLASFGHVRDLPAKKGSVDTDNGFAMQWQETENAHKSLPPILKAVGKVERVYLATDPDREGEAISWHLREILKERLGASFAALEVARITFHEITKAAITQSLADARAQLNEDLVDAYRTRRALDYLVGFSLSPLLWRKLPGARSAGRVQSVALRMICERQAAIEAFVAQEYWSVQVEARSPKGNLLARLVKYEGKRLGKLAIDSKEKAALIRKHASACSYVTVGVTPSRVQRHPQPPFITSTLQQEASNKLGFSPARTMRAAQKLYEAGSITYMRTDSFSMSAQAITEARTMLAKLFAKSGDKGDYLPAKPRFYKTKARNAQEAHESIRPTSFASKPESLASLESDQRKLYALIWRRALASQMTSAQIDKRTIDLEEDGGKEGGNGIGLRASHAHIVFDGFLALYHDSSYDSSAEDEAPDEEGDFLPALSVGDKLTPEKVSTERHETQPPPYYSEARLIRDLEQAGIGRPSTYAAILHVLKLRGYVALDGRKLKVQDSGRLATSFLRHNFTKYVDYDFTAGLEEELDKIAGGEALWRDALEGFWREFHATLKKGEELSPDEVRAQLDADWAQLYFPNDEEGVASSRLCPICKEGRLEIHPGRHGAFIGCANYPDCRFTRGLADEEAQEGSVLGDIVFPHALGVCPETSLGVYLCRGPYGLYVQRGEAAVKSKDGPAKKTKPKKPRRTALPKQFDPKTITLEGACALLSLPREVGVHPQTGKEIKAGVGRFGPYLLHDGIYSGLGEEDDIMSIGVNRSVVVIAQGGSDGRSIGEHPQGGGNVIVKKGRFGYYLRFDGINASLPRRLDPETVSLEEAIEVLAKKRMRLEKTSQNNDEDAAKPKTARTVKRTAERSVKRTIRTLTKKRTTKKEI